MPMPRQTVSISRVNPIVGLLTLVLLLGGGHAVSRADSGHHPPSQEMGDSHHSTLEIPANQPVPTVTLVAHPDPVQGWNLEVQTTDFRFAPEHVNQANRLGEGHAHLYINGEKTSRIYSAWLHLPQLPSGRYEITVGLNANGHEVLTHNGQPIESTVVIDVP